MNQQICKACGRPDKFNFHVPDEIWETVVPEHLRAFVVCLSCFDGFAAAQGLEYDIDSSLWFVGERVAFLFEKTGQGAR